MLENTPEQQEDLSDEEPADDHGLKLEEDSVASLADEKHPKRYQMLPEDANTHMTLPGPEARKGKLPPLSIVPPIRKILSLHSPPNSALLDIDLTELQYLQANAAYAFKMAMIEQQCLLFLGGIDRAMCALQNEDFLWLASMISLEHFIWQLWRFQQTPLKSLPSRW